MKGHKEMFGGQIARLEQAGYSHIIIGMLERQEDSVLEQASKIKIMKGGISFLPVIPRNYLSIKELMSGVEPKARTDVYFDPVKVSNVVQVPEHPYFIFDVRIRSDFREKPVRSEQGRSCLTVDEAINVLIHQTLPSDCYWIDACGSCYEPQNPVVRRCFQVTPMAASLLPSEYKFSDARNGAPSCLIRKCFI